MQPTRLQYFVAENWPARIWIVVVPGLITLAFIFRCWLVFSHPFDGWNLLHALIIVILAWLVGFFTAIVSGWCVLGPYYFHRSEINGAPFQIGDRVRILAGPYRDQIREIYEIWTSRNQVRLNLGAEAKDQFTDIYGYIAVCRCSDKPN